MYFINREYNNRIFYVEVSQEILDYSYPNLDFSTIANSTFEYNLLDIEKKAKSKLEKFMDLVQEKSVFMIMAHSKLSDNDWHFYDKSISYKIHLESYLIQRYFELKFGGVILNTCNNGFKFNIERLPFRVLYSNSLIGHNVNYSDEDLILL